MNDLFISYVTWEGPLNVRALDRFLSRFFTVPFGAQEAPHKNMTLQKELEALELPNLLFRRINDSKGKMFNVDALL